MPHVGPRPLISMMLSDVVMTVVAYAISWWKQNSSVYDAYWSVIPFYFVLALGTNINGGLEFTKWHNARECWWTFAVVNLWSHRLTFNWARQWDGWIHEDWRYIDLRKQHGPLFEWINFGGIHMFPTVLVFMACLPLFWIYRDRSKLDRKENIIVGSGVFLSFLAICIQGVADNQLINYRRRAKPVEGEILDSGLWGLVRHPNYFGEMMYWWGIWCIGSGCGGPYWTIMGPASITALFIFISIPMKEERMKKSRPRWSDYSRRVPALIPKPLYDIWRGLFLRQE
jgi:steroid 5-alpha reductase family enzyme